MHALFVHTDNIHNPKIVLKKPCNQFFCSKFSAFPGGNDNSVFCFLFYEGVVKKLFNENKPIFFGILGVVFIILLIILIQCHRKYCKKDNKTEQKKASNYTLSFSKEELHLPQWKKSPVQPKRRKQRKPMEIVRNHK